MTIRVVSSSSERAASIAVIDDGAGVASSEIPSLLKRFARGAGAQGGGAGLGLSIVDTLARRMGATLVLRSPPADQAVGLEARLSWETPRPAANAGRMRTGLNTR
jgi:signal transduction histidine kinase